MLFEVRGRAYCGPTAIAAVTGHPVEYVEFLIKSRTSGLTEVKGVSILQLWDAVSTLGWTCTKLGTRRPNRNPYTIKDFVEEHASGPYILLAPDHYLAYSHGFLVDTEVMYPQKLTYWRNKRREDMSVEGWWKLKRKEQRSYSI